MCFCRRGAISLRGQSICVVRLLLDPQGKLLPAGFFDPASVAPAYHVYPGLLLVDIFTWSIYPGYRSGYSSGD